jgi:glycosyl hydrolase family 106( putative alpha-L-rhamnosidase)
MIHKIFKSQNFIKLLFGVFVFLTFILNASSSYANAEIGIDEMQRKFMDPPIDCRPHTRWWWMGNAVTKDEITWQLEEMFAKGIGGVEQISMGAVYEKGNVEYLSEDYLDKLDHAVKTAKRLGMNISVNFGGPGWVIGGAWVPPQDRSKSLVPTFIDLEGPQTFKGDLPIKLSAPTHSWELPLKQITADDELVAVIAAKVVDDSIDKNSITILISQANDRAIEWSVPEGRWRLMAFWLKYTGQGETVDHFSQPAMRRYCHYLGAKFKKTFGDEFGKTVDSFFCDSFELALAPNGIYWSNGLLDEFKRKKGYDLTHYLPAIWWNIGEATPKIRYDVNQFLHEIGMEAFFDPFLGWCSVNGIQGRIQPYGFATDNIQGAGITDIPEMEITAGEKDAVPWFDTRIGPKKYVASGAHLYGKNIVSTEAYTFLHWQPFRTTLEELKIASDIFLKSGANKFYNHGYSCSPERDAVPSRSMGAAIHISHDNVWWKHYPHFAEYLARCCWMLRQGEPTADIAIYSPLANQWTLDVLNARRWTRDFQWGDLGKLITANGYDFDLINDDILQNCTAIEPGQLQVWRIDEQIKFDYKVIIIPNIKALPLQTLEIIQSYVRKGGVAIALEQVPDSSTGLHDYHKNDRAVHEIVNEMFDKPKGEFGTGPKQYGDGTTYFIKNVMHRTDQLDWKSSLQDTFVNTLRQHVAPDFGIDFNREGMRRNNGLIHIHRRLKNAELYFVTNVQDRAIDLPVTFRVHDAVPYEWNPYTGNIRQLYEFCETQNGIEIPITLAPYESTFILFEYGRAKIHALQSQFKRIDRITYDAVEAIADHNGTFLVHLSDDLGKTKPVRIEDLPALFAIEGEWKLTFEGNEFPRINKTLHQLESWTLDPQTKRFSGTASYEISFDIPPSYLRNDILLELDPGKIGNIAEFHINGASMGTVWMRGQTLDITNALQANRNRMTVLVTNTLINRVSNYKEPRPIPDHLAPIYGSAVPPLSKGSHSPVGFKPLPPSGLIGPVTIRAYKKVVIDIQN